MGGLVTAVGRRFRGENHDVARLELLVALKAPRLHPEHRHAGVSTLVGRHVQQPGLRVLEVRNGREVRITREGAPICRRQQLLAVDDLERAVVAHTPGGVDAIADHVAGGSAARELLRGLRVLERGDRSVQRSSCVDSRSVRLCAHQAVCPDVGGTADRRGICGDKVVAAGGVVVDVRIAPVVDQHRLGLAPQWRRTQGRVLAPRHVGDAGRAFPPVLVR